MRKIIFLFAWLMSIVSVAESQQIEYDKVITYKTQLSWEQPSEFSSILYVGQKESCFILSQPKESVKKINIEEGKMYYNSGTKYPKFVIKKFNDDKILFLGQVFKKYCLVSDRVPAIKWKILSDTKQIGNYKCQKAIGQFRGRKYTVWFSVEVPLALGPWKLGGLPGLIFEASDSTANVSFNLVSIKNKTGEIEFNTSNLQKKTWKEFEECTRKAWKIMISYMTSLESDKVHVGKPKLHLLEPSIMQSEK